MIAVGLLALIQRNSEYEQLAALHPAEVRAVSQLVDQALARQQRRAARFGLIRFSLGVAMAVPLGCLGVWACSLIH